ncbi:histidine phosphatase family protein [Thermodesulfobacteriota bacterium]
MDREVERQTAKILLARHGETESNRGGRVLGQSDSPLTSQGAASSRTLAESLRNEPIKIVFSSPLGRAVATAGLFAEKFGLPVMKRDGLAELSCGSWESRPRKDVLGERPLLRTTWTDRPPEGESYQDAEPRVGTVIEELSSFSGDDTVLVVGHAAVNRVFLKMWLDLALEPAIDLHIPHDAVYILGRGNQLSMKRANGEKIRFSWLHAANQSTLPRP